MDKKTHQKTFPLLASKMPSSDSAYTKFKQNDRTIENPGEWEEKRRNNCRNLPTLLYRQNLRYNYQKYLTNWHLNLIKFFSAFQKKYTYTTTKWGQVYEEPADLQTSDLQMAHVTAAEFSPVFLYTRKNYFLFEFVYPRTKLNKKQLQNKIAVPSPRTHIIKSKNYRWKKNLSCFKNCLRFFLISKESFQIIREDFSHPERTSNSSNMILLLFFHFMVAILSLIRHQGTPAEPTGFDRT